MNDTIKLQKLYDLQKLTKFCPIWQLHDFFKLIALEPSPSGEMEVSRQQIASHPIGQEALTILASPLADVLYMFMEHPG